MAPRLSAVVAGEQVCSVCSMNFDDEGHLWFGCWLKDGRSMSICYELNEAIENEALTEFNKTDVCQENHYDP